MCDIILTSLLTEAKNAAWALHTTASRYAAGDQSAEQAQANAHLYGGVLDNVLAHATTRALRVDDDTTFYAVRAAVEQGWAVEHALTAETTDALTVQ